VSAPGSPVRAAPDKDKPGSQPGGRVTGEGEGSVLPLARPWARGPCSRWCPWHFQPRIPIGQPEVDRAGCDKQGLCVCGGRSRGCLSCPWSEEPCPVLLGRCHLPPACLGQTLYQIPRPPRKNPIIIF
jgi:hypothetical protein